MVSHAKATVRLQRTRARANLVRCCLQVERDDVNAHRAARTRIHCRNVSLLLTSVYNENGEPLLRDGSCQCNRRNGTHDIHNAIQTRYHESKHARFTGRMSLSAPVGIHMQVWGSDVCLRLSSKVLTLPWTAFTRMRAAVVSGDVDGQFPGDVDGQFPDDVPASRREGRGFQAALSPRSGDSRPRTTCRPHAGTAAAERVACSPPTKANRVQSLAGSLPDLRWWESCRTMPLVGGFSRGSPVPPPFHSGAAPYSPQSSAFKTSFLRAAAESGLKKCSLYLESPIECCMTVLARRDAVAVRRRGRRLFDPNPPQDNKIPSTVPDRQPSGYDPAANRKSPSSAPVHGCETKKYER
ncbi:hypothetical protein PR048_018452 [Dryococelus australis]|uniref:Uncharacterized protein n=1 Tax=Dryococelus australis TaxID=614101 RepID=A0ABQ9HCI3_9NEOP|nr:hypothetical protein PR048_018452 [Dryococelus australis]